LAEIYHMWINWYKLCHINVMSLRFEVHKVDLKDNVREPWSRLVEMLHFVLMTFWLKTTIQYLWNKRSSERPGQMIFFEQFLKIMTPGSSCFHLTKILGPLGSPWVYPFGYWPRSCYFTPETQTARGPKLPLETVHPGIPATIATGRSGRLVQNNCQLWHSYGNLGLFHLFPLFFCYSIHFYSSSFCWVDEIPGWSTILGRGAHTDRSLQS
jgi:hypothetical protein